MNYLLSKSLVLIVGAGASKELDLPLGEELKHKISKSLDINYEYRNVISGDQLINKCFATLNQSHNMAELLKAAHQIRDAMPLAISIDNFVDAHKANNKIEVCAKLAIVRNILEAERRSKLWFESSGQSNHLKHNMLGNTWLAPFFQILTENCQLENLESRLSKIAIISFNYDRCIEHYLYDALQVYYQISKPQARDLVSKLEIHHPYGSTGGLPWSNSDTKIGFGQTPTDQELIDISNKIKTFTEGLDEKTDISKIRQNIIHADKLVFIGFAFHKLNLEVLFDSPTEQTSTKNIRVFATGKGISSDDAEMIKSELYQYGGLNPNLIKIECDKTCTELLNHFRRSISLV